MSERSFTHLHTHTEFSMLDGAARVGDLVAAAVLTPGQTTSIAAIPSSGNPATGIGTMTPDGGFFYAILTDIDTPQALELAVGAAA